MNNSKKIYTYVKALAVVGVLLSVYLLWQQIFQPAFKPCSINATINCDAVISGPVAKTLGIPTPLYGLIGYLVIMFAAFKRNKKLLMAMTTFGLGFCLYLGYVEIFNLHVVCPVCITCQLVMAVIFILGIILMRKPSSED
jgi:uncharacterized membrane protein